MARGGQYGVEALSVNSSELGKASGEVSVESRSLPKGGPGHEPHQRRYIDWTPWSMQNVFYPLRIRVAEGADRLIEADNINEGTVSDLDRK